MAGPPVLPRLTTGSSAFSPDSSVSSVSSVCDILRWGGSQLGLSPLQPSWNTLWWLWAQSSQLSYLGTSQGSLIVYFSQGAGEPGLTAVLSCIIRVAHSESQAGGGQDHWTTVVGRTVERVGAPEALNTPRYGNLGRRSSVSWSGYHMSYDVISLYIIVLSGVLINDKKICVKVW